MVQPIVINYRSCLYWFIEMGLPVPFLFISVLFKHKFSRKTVSVSRIQTWIAGVEGKHFDHLTITTDQIFVLFEALNDLSNVNLH